MPRLARRSRQSTDTAIRPWLAPVLVANGTHDPATPLSWARSLTAQFDHARLYVYDGDGHTVTPHSGAGRRAEADHLVHPH
ncbi:alpha/beta hydrolase [Streptomyces lasalocidi]